MKRFDIPKCFEGLCTRDVYLRWLQRKAQAHVRRDRKRFGKNSCTISKYKSMIHDAVSRGGDCDYYTGLPLDWSLISKYSNEVSKQRRGEYWKEFSSLPTVDHAHNATGQPCFVICSLRVNDAKSHLSEEEFWQLCNEVLGHKNRRL